jgi:ferredoxin
MEYLSPKTEKEDKVLKVVEATNPCPNLRLSCQMKIDKPNGHVRLKY